MIIADDEARTSAYLDDDGFQIRREPERAEEAGARRPKARARPHRARPEPLAPATMAGDAREQIVIVAKNLSAEVKKHPVLAVAAAVGIGFVLGGAMSMRLGRAALAAAGRWALKRVAARL